MRYRLDHVAGVYRLNGLVPEEFNFKTGHWEWTHDAADEFMEGLSSCEVDEAQAFEYIEKVKSLKASKSYSKGEGGNKNE
nr:MAG TPA: hypothetical protein [Caudoviricetes sp.]